MFCHHTLIGATHALETWLPPHAFRTTRPTLLLLLSGFLQSLFSYLNCKMCVEHCNAFPIPNFAKCTCAILEPHIGVLHLLFGAFYIDTIPAAQIIVMTLDAIIFGDRSNSYEVLAWALSTNSKDCSSTEIEASPPVRQGL